MELRGKSYTLRRAWELGLFVMWCGKCEPRGLTLDLDDGEMSAGA